MECGFTGAKVMQEEQYGTRDLSYSAWHKPASIRRLVLCMAGVLAVSGCDGLDKDYYPYMMTGLNAYAYDLKSGEAFSAGFVEANYFQRESATLQCADLAGWKANRLHLRNWGYVCCTATSSSSCMTKVK